MSKRPAAAMKKPSSSIHSLVQDMKAEAAKEEEPEEEKGQQTRDKGKAEKFSKMLKAGQLPPMVVYMWEYESKKAVSQRQFQTNLINNLFTRQEDGTYRMNTDSQEFKEYQSIYTRHQAKDKKKGMPRGVMLASHFHGDSRALDRSIADGEIQSFKDPESGVEFLTFRELSVTETKTNEKGETVSGTKKLKIDQAHQLAGLMNKMKWQWGMKEASVLYIVIQESLCAPY